MSRHVRDRDAYESDKWFNDWHRDSLGNEASMIDLDGLGYCQRCQQPLYVVEATRSRMVKAAWVADRVAHDTGALLLVLYKDERDMPGHIGFDLRYGDGLRSKLLSTFGLPPAGTKKVWWLCEADAAHILRTIRSEHRCVESETA